MVTTDSSLHLNKWGHIWPNPMQIIKRSSIAKTWLVFLQLNVRQDTKPLNKQIICLLCALTSPHLSYRGIVFVSYVLSISPCCCPQKLFSFFFPLHRHPPENLKFKAEGDWEPSSALKVKSGNRSPSFKFMLVQWRWEFSFLYCCQQGKNRVPIRLYPWKPSYCNSE